jgi:hypothetical protein
MIPLIKALSKKISWLSKTHIWLKQKMLWNATISFVLQQYPIIVLSSGINIYGLSFKNLDAGKYVSTIISILLIVASVAIIPLCFVIVRRIKNNHP